MVLICVLHVLIKGRFSSIMETLVVARRRPGGRKIRPSSCSEPVSVKLRVGLGDEGSGGAISMDGVFHMLFGSGLQPRKNHAM